MGHKRAITAKQTSGHMIRTRRTTARHPWHRPLRAQPTPFSAPEGAGTRAGAGLLGLGIAATLAANVAHSIVHGLIGAAV